jgi:hypothetical protein
MAGITALTEDQARAAALADALDLEPITFKLMHPHPGETAMPLADADQMVEAYRSFLKLCLWYPDEPIVPSKAIDEAWHAHILDTAKYAADCAVLFGGIAHHFPYFGLRGPGDEARWHAAWDRTRELFSQHFGTVLDGDRGAPACHVNGASCKADNGAICMFDESVTCEKTMEADGQLRPRPDRAAAGM